MTNHSHLHKSRQQIGIRLGVLSVIVNLVLFAIKLFLGIVSNSISVISDAFHTLSDTITSALVVVSFKISGKPSDLEHPFGHGRAEQISAIVMATLLGVTAFELGKSGVERFLDPSPINASFIIAGVMLATIFVKEWLARYTQKYAKQLDSNTLEADAWHHRSDAISTIFVVISIVLARYGIVFLDGFMGIVIALYILYTAYEIVKKPIDHIMGTPTPADIALKIKKIGYKISDIIDLHDIVYHDYGSNKLVSLHIEVDEEMPLKEAHYIAEIITEQIREKLDIFATVHVDPMSPKTELHDNIEKLINEFCHSNDLCHSFHELRLHQDEAEVKILFELQINKEVSGKTKRVLKEKITEILKANYPQIKQVKIEIDPLFLLDTDQSGR